MPFYKAFEPEDRPTLQKIFLIARWFDLIFIIPDYNYYLVT